MLGDTMTDGSSRAVEQLSVLRAILGAEAQLIRRLREEASQRCKIKSDIQTICGELNHENVFHVARFFFLLKTLDCSTPEAIEALLVNHNKKVKSLIEAGDFDIRTPKELKKALFSEVQIFVCKRTLGDGATPALAKTEIAALLFEHMGRDSAMRTLDLLISAGLLIEIEVPSTSSNRKLIKTTGVIESAVSVYLSFLRSSILNRSE